MLRATSPILRWFSSGSLLAPLVGVLVASAATDALAAPPWASLVPFSKKVEADPNKSYELDESHGPWMIMCVSFAGPTAERQAQDLVLELRQQFHLEAYTFRQTFDFSKSFESPISRSKYGGFRRMKYLNDHKFEEIAVLVGHFSSVDSPQIEATLEKIKYAHPMALERNVKQSSQRFAGLRHIYRLVNLDPEKQTKGPMGAAFISRNPLLPEELFTAKGLDPFVVEMNQDLPHSLLKCPGNYSVRVATFRGVDTMKPDVFAKLTSNPDRVSKIDQAALKASKLCAALRAKGIEAYEFHDRTESIVTVGSFNEVGTPRPDGKTEINPQIHAIMKQYGPIEQNLPGSSVAQVFARTLNGIAFDPQPLPVQVPRESIAATYDPANSLLRQ